MRQKPNPFLTFFFLRIYTQNGQHMMSAYRAHSCVENIVPDPLLRKHFDNCTRRERSSNGKDGKQAAANSGDDKKFGIDKRTALRGDDMLG